jgi:hypothetical protein
VPGTSVVSPRTEISFRGVAPAGIGVVAVVGARSGRHAGRLLAHADGRGASFVPSRPFAPGERVSVVTHLRLRGTAGGRFAYTVARPAVETARSKPPGRAPKILTRFRSQPALRLTTITVTKAAPSAAPGLVFLAPRRGAGQNGVELLDADGAVVWFRPLPEGVQAADFREQTFRGRPVLTWWQGRLGAGHGYGVGVSRPSARETATRQTCTSS